MQSHPGRRDTGCAPKGEPKMMEMDQGTRNVLYNWATTLQLAADEDLKAAQARNELAQLQLEDYKFEQQRPKELRGR
jgi:hypothetical protein